MPMVQTTLILEPETGTFQRLLKNGEPLKTTPYRTNRGYIYINIGAKKSVAVHRLMWEHVNGPIPEGMEIDHIDGNPSNNKISNLRCVTRIQNSQNRHRASRKNKTSYVKGVHWDTRRQKWRSHIVVNKKQVYIGRFDTIEEAAKAYAQAAAVYHTHNPSAAK